MMTNLPWQITLTNEGDVNMNDSVSFDTTTLEVKIKGSVWGFLDSTSTSLAASSTASLTTVTGTTTSSGQPFHIDQTGTTLSCYLDAADDLRLLSRGHRLALGLGLGVGILLGEAVGRFAGVRLLGGMAGLIGGAGSLGVVALAVNGGASARGSSSPTWVANGPDGKPFPQGHGYPRPFETPSKG